MAGAPSLSPAVEPGASEVEESSVERQWLRHATAAEAEAAAAREGLPLIRSAASATRVSTSVETSTDLLVGIPNGVLNLPDEKYSVESAGTD